MQDAVLGIVADFLNHAPHKLRADLTRRLAQELAIDPGRANQVVRDLFQSRIIDHVTVCYYNLAANRVVMEPGVARGAHFDDAGATRPLAAARAS